MALEKRINPVDLAAEKLLKGKKAEKVEIRTEQPEKVENLDELAGEYIKSLEGRMGGPVELRREIPSEFEPQRQEIIKPATEIIKGISLKGVDIAKINPRVLEILARTKKAQPKPEKLDTYSQLGGRGERLAM